MPAWINSESKVNRESVFFLCCSSNLLQSQPSDTLLLFTGKILLNENQNRPFKLKNWKIITLWFKKKKCLERHVCSYLLISSLYFIVCIKYFEGIVEILFLLVINSFPPPSYLRFINLNLANISFLNKNISSNPLDLLILWN